MHWLSLLGNLLGIVLILLLLRRVLQSASRLNQKIQKYKAEQEEREKQGIPFNPYLELSQLYQDDTEQEQRSKRKKNKLPH